MKRINDLAKKIDKKLKILPLKKYPITKYEDYSNLPEFDYHEEKYNKK